MHLALIVKTQFIEQEIWWLEQHAVIDLQFECKT